MEEIEPEHVTLQQAKLFQEKGFDVECCDHWEEGKKSDTPDEWKINGYGEASTDNYPAPEQWVVVEWLRTRKNIWVSVDINPDYDLFFFCIRKVKKGTRLRLNDINDMDYYDTPQKAYSAAFDYVLKEII